jgi:hypothetical protein
MKQDIFRLLTLLMITGTLSAQSGVGGGGQSNVSGGQLVQTFAGVPTGTCGANALAVDTTNGHLYSCNGGIWTQVGGTSGVSSVTASAPLASSGGVTPNITSGTLANSPTASSGATFYLSSTSDCLTPAVTGTTTCAINNLTSAIDFSGTDADSVVRSELANFNTTGGKFTFKNGTYNCNAPVQESTGGYTLWYCFGIPSSATTTYPTFIFEGEGGNTGANVGILGVGTPTGVIFNVTAAARTVAGAGNLLAAWWQRPNTAALGSGHWNTQDIFNNLAVMFPDNQRGNEYAYDLLEASYASWNQTNASFVTAPVALGATNLKAYVTPATYSDGTWLIDTFAAGWTVGYSVNTEHSHLRNTLAYRCTTAYIYGDLKSTANQSIFHASDWIHPQAYDSVHAISIGPNINQGAVLDIIGFDMEYITTTVWAFVDSIVETTPGTTSGHISWSNIKTNVGLGNLASPFKAGSGGTYTVIQQYPSGSTSNDFGGTSYSTASKNGVVGLISQNTQLPISGLINQVICQISTVAITSNVLTVNCQNTFTLSTTFGAGTAINLAGLTTNTFLNGQSVTVSTSTSSSFTAAFVHANVGSTSDTGVATAQGEMRLETRAASLIDASNTAGELQFMDGARTNFAGVQYAGVGAGSATFLEPVKATRFNTATNCASGASPAVCGSAAAGDVAVPTGATPTLQINTTAITANSQIQLTVTEAATVGTRLSVTCNSTLSTLVNPVETARVAGASVTIQMNSTLVTNPACVHYAIVN